MCENQAKVMPAPRRLMQMSIGWIASNRRVPYDTLSLCIGFVFLRSWNCRNLTDCQESIFLIIIHTSGVILSTITPNFHLVGVNSQDWV